MTMVASGSKIILKNILFLTDFSKASEVALPYAAAIARNYGAKVYALNVFEPATYSYTTPELTVAAIQAEEDSAKFAMTRVESRFSGLGCEAILERGIDVWPAVDREIKRHAIDLIVLGTRGRTGTKKLLFGSVAEEIFRRSAVPVLTIGPGVCSTVQNGGQFQRVLFATDFSAASISAAPYALTLAQENHARLLLLHVMPRPDSRNGKEDRRFELSVAEALQKLYDTVPKDAEFYMPPEAAVEYGEPAERIIAAAEERRADLIVLGLRNATDHIGAATHLERATAHKVVSHAACPVLTVRHCRNQA
jgi:nucleotide-binding universal stress UspA family protein